MIESQRLAAFVQDCLCEGVLSELEGTSAAYQLGRGSTLALGLCSLEEGFVIRHSDGNSRKYLALRLDSHNHLPGALQLHDAAVQITAACIAHSKPSSELLLSTREDYIYILL